MGGLSSPAGCSHEGRPTTGGDTASYQVMAVSYLVRGLVLYYYVCTSGVSKFQGRLTEQPQPAPAPDMSGRALGWERSHVASVSMADISLAGSLQAARCSLRRTEYGLCCVVRRFKILFYVPFLPILKCKLFYGNP